MKYIKTYESLYGDVLRVNPKRKINDNKLRNLFNEILEDFEKYDKDLKKVKIIDENGRIIKIDSSLELGLSGSLTYIFGKYHPLYNNIHSGNQREGNRKITIKYIPFIFIFKRNELEKMFNVNRLKNQNITVKDVKTIKNPNYNPNLSTNLMKRDSEPTEKERSEMVLFYEKEDEYKVSPDVAGKILKYFIDQYNVKYPKLKKSTYKGPMQISDIEKGVEPTLKYKSIKNKYGEDVIYSIRYGEDDKEQKKIAYNMPKKEYDEYSKKLREEMYKPYYDKQEKEKTKIKNIILKLLKDYNINKNPYDIRIMDSRINFAFMDIDNEDVKNIENKIRKLVKDDFFKEYEPHIRVDKDYRKKDMIDVNLEKI